MLLWENYINILHCSQYNNNRIPSKLCIYIVSCIIFEIIIIACPKIELSKFD